jgi:hypothetical protein
MAAMRSIVGTAISFVAFVLGVAASGSTLTSRLAVGFAELTVSLLLTYPSSPNEGPAR